MEATLSQTLFEPETWGASCSDLGDISMLMPAVHPHIGGAAGASHGDRYTLPQAEDSCVNSAKVQLVMLQLLLKDGAARAEKILADFEPAFASKEEYFRHVDAMTARWEAVGYNENGSVTLLPAAEAEP